MAISSQPPGLDSPVARLAWSWRSGRLRRYRHLAGAVLSTIPNWFRLLLLQLDCRLHGRRLVTVALIEHFGDIVACEPVARHLRRNRPGACIAWCLRAPYRELVRHNSNVDKVLIVGCLTEWILLRKSGLAGEVVDLHLRGRQCPLCWVPLQKQEGDPGLNINNYYNFGSLLQASAQSAGLGALEDSRPRLYLPAAAVEAVDRLNLPEEFIVFHARANESERDWDDEKWAALLELVRQDLKVATVEIGLSAVAPSASPGYRNLCGRTGLLELGEVIRRASVFVGLDSGPAHLGNAAGTPGVILLGRYRSFRRYLPYSGGYGDGTLAKLIYADGLTASLSVGEVYAVVADFWKRRRLSALEPSAAVNLKTNP